MADLYDLDIEKKRRFRAELARTEALPKGEFDDYVRVQLEGIALFAWRSVPYWRKRLAPVFAHGQFDAEAWLAVPPLTRPIIAAKLRELAPLQLPAYAGAARMGETSGSTGAPLRFRTCASAEIANAALTERSYDWWGLECHRTAATIHFLPPSWPSLVEGGISGWRNGTPPGRHLALQIATPIDQQLAWLERWRPDYLFTRPSQAELLADAHLGRGKELALRAIVTINEPVSEQCRALCREAFGAEIYDTYGSSECGHIAAQCPDCGLLHVSAEARLVEVVREDGAPCAPGEVGRVLVTSYSNFAMPVLRYDLGDFAELGPAAAPCGRPFPSLVRVLGRTTETFVRRGGARFFPAVLARQLAQVMPLRQVQFAQTDYEVVEIRYVPRDGAGPIDLEAVQRYVKSRLGEEFSARLVPMQEIPRAPSGKYLYHRCEVPNVQPAAAPIGQSSAVSSSSR